MTTFLDLVVGAYFGALSTICWLGVIMWLAVDDGSSQ